MLRLADAHRTWSETVLTGLMTDHTRMGDSAGGPHIAARWLSADTLEVTFDSTMEAGDEPSTVHGIAIKYRPQ